MSVQRAFLMSYGITTITYRVNKHVSLKLGIIEEALAAALVGALELSEGLE